VNLVSEARVPARAVTGPGLRPLLGRASPHGCCSDGQAGQGETNPVGVGWMKFFSVIINASPRQRHQSQALGSHPFGASGASLFYSTFTEVKEL
jgi:hypothetical protein